MAIVDPFKPQSNSAGTGIVDPFKAPRATLQRTPVQPDKPEGFIDSAVAGFKRSLPETKALLGGAVGLAGDLVGSDTVRDYGLGIYKNTMEQDVAPLQTAEFTDVLEGRAGLGDFAGGAVGNIGGQMLQSLAAAGAGALGGAAVGSPTGPGAAVTGTLGAIGGLVARKGAKEVIGELTEKLIKDQVAKGVGREAAEAGARSTLTRIGAGAAVAPVALNIGQESGGTYGTASEVAAEEGRELTTADNLRVLGSGVAGGLLDTVADLTGVGSLAGRTGANVVGRVAQGALAQGAIEGTTETAQQALQRFGAQQELTGEEANREYLNSFAAGAIGGGAIGGVGGIRQAEEEAQTEQDLGNTQPQPEPNRVLPPSPTTEAALRIRAETAPTPAERESARAQLAAMMESQGRMIPGPGQTPINVTPAGEARTAAQELGIAQQRAGELDQQASVGLTPDVLAAQQRDPRATLQRFPGARPGSLADAANSIVAAPNLTPVTSRPTEAAPTAAQPEPQPAPVVPPGVDPQTGEVLPEQGEEAARRAILSQLEQGRVVEPRMIAGATGITPRRASEIRSEIQQQRKAEAKAAAEGRNVPAATEPRSELPAPAVQQGELMEPETTPQVARPPLSVRMGDQEFPVDSIEDASRKFLEVKDRTDIGGMQAVRLIDQNGVEVGFVGQSGEVYDTPLSQIRSNPNVAPVYRPPAQEPAAVEQEASAEPAALPTPVSTAPAPAAAEPVNAYRVAADAVESREPVEKALANLDDAQVRAVAKAMKMTFSPKAVRNKIIEKIASAGSGDFRERGLPILRQLAGAQQASQPETRAVAAPEAPAAAQQDATPKPKPARGSSRRGAETLQPNAEGATVDATADVLRRQEPDPAAAERFAKIDEGFEQNRERLAKKKFKKGETVSYVQSGEVKTGVIESIEKDQGMAMVGNSFVAVRRLFRPGEEAPTPAKPAAVEAAATESAVEGTRAADDADLAEAKKEWGETLGFKVGDRVRSKDGGPVRVIEAISGKYLSYRAVPNDPGDLSTGSIKATNAVRVEDDPAPKGASEVKPRISQADYDAAIRKAKEAFTSRAEKMKADALKQVMRRALGFRGVKPAGTRTGLIEQGQQAIEAGDFDLVTDVGASVAPSVMEVLEARRGGRVGPDDSGARAAVVAAEKEATAPDLKNIEALGLKPGMAVAFKQMGKEIVGEVESLESYQPGTVRVVVAAGPNRGNYDIPGSSLYIPSQAQAAEPAAEAPPAPKKGLNEARRDATLDKMTSEGGKSMTRRQWVDGKVAEGLATKITMEDRVAPMTRAQFNRATNEEQRAHERRVKAGGKKEVYWIGDYTVTKTEHDYANELIAAKASPAAAVAAEAIESPLAATHADKGEAPQAADATDVAQAAAKVARAPAVSMAEARQTLLAKIDEAIAQLPVDDPKYQKLVKDYEDAAENHSLVKSEKNKREFIRAGISAANRIGLVTLAVPGDGTFKVLRSKARLEAFRKQVAAQFKLKPDQTFAPDGKYESRSLGMTQAQREAIMAEAESFDPESEVAAAAAEAATSPENDLPAPTEAQKEAGNYKKGHIVLNGLDITIENPAGSKRREEWPALAHHYGYIKRTEGADGDHVDVFMSDDAGNADLPVFIVDQRNRDGGFDEHKVMLGWPDEAAARAAYLANYTKGWRGLGAITPISLDDFKTWLRDGETTKPVAYEPPAEAAAAPALTPATEGLRPKVRVKGGKPEYVLGHPDTLAAYFAPGRIIKGYGGLDRVIEFRPTEGDRSWSVQVQRVDADGNDMPGERPRWHSTSPEPRDLVRDFGPPVAPAKAERAAPAAPATTESGAAPAIDDFGETLLGARKHLAGEYAKRLDDAATLNVAAEPFSRTWPEPDYQKLLENGADPFVVAFVRAMRDEIPRKPVAKWKVGGWAQKVTELRNFATALLKGGDLGTKLAENLASPEYAGKLGGVKGRAELYQTFGHERSLQGVRFGQHHYTLYRGERDVTRWTVEKDRAASAYSNWPHELAVGKTKEEALEAFRGFLAKEAEAEKQAGAEASGAKMPRFDIYSRRGSEGFIIGVRVRGGDALDLRRFATAKEARAFLAVEGNAETLAEEVRKLREAPSIRRDLNAPRVGIDHRNGADVTPEQFGEAFGFRGVQFGNYVEGPRRQQDLNNAYDALMDLAGVIGIPARALSLNGTLGLAFGARGKGGKNAGAAHFETGTIVINLTKGAGAGSLAHEWFHGLDNYFARQRGAPIGFATVEAKAGDAHRDLPMRTEMRGAFLRLVKAITDTGIKARSDALDKLRSKAYWGTKEEMSARAFESYVIAKLGEAGAANDYLANVVPETAFSRESGYPYPTAAELPTIRAAFDDFFQTIETGPGQNGAVALFSQPGQVDERIVELYREFDSGEDADGRQTFMSEQDLLDSVEGIIRDSDTVPESIREAARRFRQEIREDEDEWGGRGDSLAAGGDFVSAIANAIGGQFSAQAGPVRGVDTAELDAAISAIKANWQGDAPEVLVKDTPADLPDDLRRQPGALTAEGVYYRGRVYLIASNLSSIERAKKVLAHEAFGHYGVEAVVGEREWAAITRDIGAMFANPSKQSDAMQAVIQSIRERYPKVDAETRAKETIAVMAEQGVQAGVLNRVVAAVRRLLRRLGLLDGFNESDLRDIVSQGMRHVKGPSALAAPRLLDVMNAPRAAFSSAMSPTATASRVLRLMAKHDTLFKFSKSSATTLEGVFKDVAPKFNVLARGDLKISFEHNDPRGRYATDADVFQIREAGKEQKARLFVERGGKNRMFLDISEFKSGEGLGAGVYAALFNYAHNAGKVFIGDPTGLSDEALLRRTEHMLSAALKFGTTRMMEPHPRQVNPLGQFDGYKPQTWAHPVEWLTGNDAHNIAALLDTSYHNHRQFILEVPGVRDDLRAISLRGDSGAGFASLPDGELVRIAREAGARFAAYSGASFGESRAPAIGPASVARFVLAESAVSNAGAPERLAWLVDVAERLSTGGLTDAEKGLFYSQPGPDAAQPGEPLFSQPDPKSIDDAIGEAAKDPPLTDRIRQAFDDATKGGNLEDKARRALLYGVTLRHIAELGGKLLPSLNGYVQTVQQMATDRNAMQEDAAKIADTWERAQRKDRRGADDTANLMHDATVEGVDPDADYQPLTFQTFETVNEDGKATERRVERTVNRRNVEAEVQAIKRRTRGADDATKAKAKERIAQLEERLAQEQRRADAYPVLAARWQALPDQWKQLYREARDAYAAQSKRYEDALVQRIEDLVEEGATRASYVAQIRQQFESQRLEGPYFPLARFGSFWISARTPNGEPAFFMYETKAEWRRAQADLKSRGYDIRAASEKFESVNAGNGPSSGFMADLMDTLGKAGVAQDAKDAVYQLYLRSLPDLSIRKHFIHRKKTSGYSADALRAFAGNLFHGSFQIARLRHSHNLELALRGMREREAELAKTDPEKAQQAAQIIGEMTHRHEWVMNPKDSAATNALTSLGFVWYLGVSPAAALINLSQVPIVTFPVLAAKFGAGKASAALMEGMRRAIAHVNGDITRGLSEEERRAFKVWYESGAIDKSMAHGLAGLSETDTQAFNPVYRRTMEVVSWLFHKAEVVNREATALAAFRLARDSGMTEQAATQYAGEAIWESHFDYTNANRARWMQGNVAKVVFLFRQYSLNMSWFLWRNAYQALKGESKEVQRDARRKLAGVMGMTGLFSGVLGLPLASVAFGVANAAAAAFGDDEEPWDAEIAFRNFLADYLGPEAGRLITGGAVEAATGLEVSSRTSLNDLWIREPDRELEGEAMGNYILQTLAGPVGGIGFGFLRGAQLLEEGHPWRAMESMVPKFIRDGLRSLRYADEGVTTLRGDPIIEELSLGETLAQISGFGPSRLADQYKANSAIKGYEERLLKKRQRLLNAFATAAQAGDEESMRETLARIRRWNSEVPQLAVDRDTIDRSLRQRARYSGRAVAGTVVDRRIEAQAREQARFAEVE